MLCCSAASPPAKTEASALLHPPARHETATWKATFVVLSLAFLVDRASEFATDGMGRAFEEQFRTTPNALSTLSLCQAISLALCSPIWGYLADLYPRTRLLAIGCSAWAFFMICASCAPHFWTVVLFQGLAGCMLGSVRPNVLGMVADTVPMETQGSSYGILLGSGALGGLGGVVYANSVSEKLLFGSVNGWRVVFFTLALAAVALAVATLLFARDPRGDSRSERAAGSFSNFLSELWLLLQIKTFVLITICSALCYTPFKVGTFWVLCLRYSGFSQTSASGVFAVGLVATIAGNVFGGKAGDLMAAKHPDMGRIWLAQLSTTCSIACALVCLLAVPTTPEYSWCFAVIFAIFGFFGQGYSAGANNPMLAAVSPPELRSTIMAWAYGLEIAGAAILGPPFVGLIAQEGFGYIPSQETDISNVPDEQRSKNAIALRNALLIMTVVPFAIATMLYSLIGKIYPRDRDAQLVTSKSVI
ncbi:hypothetical protein AB1Y20_001502 [Prymnesium parvum]|uniref:Major facilitator superfamily (MFS) profile domain-containing protein n=1 Tax=Prymnesium parvum TaxID=97485 RepID=A0AB34KB25_PRYPA